jgi:signal transduction histidine kinase
MTLARWSRQIPLSLKVPLLVAALMIAVAGIVSKLVLMRLEATQAQHFRDLTEAYLDGLSTALMPATIRREPWEAFDALDRSRSRYAGVHALLVVVLLPDGRVLAASDPLRHPVGALAPAETLPALAAVLDGATAWIHRPLVEGGVAVGRIAAEVDLSLLLADRREAVWALLGVNAALTLLFAGLGWLLVQRMLRPVFRLSERLARATDGRLEPVPAAELPPAHTAEGRAFRRYNTAAAAVAEREALLARLAAEERRALVGRYASAMAHEVNNPLGGLFNAVRMIQRHGEDPVRRRRAADLLERGLTGIHNIVRASLMLWRGEADLRPLTLSDIEDVRLLIDSEARRRDLQLDWHVALQEAPMPPAQAFRQIALNLLLNACAASPPGATLTVRATSEPGALLLSIADHGPGLPAEAASILLGRHGDTLPQAGGLGLWTVARLARELGASIDITGPPGTIIRIRIPHADKPGLAVAA